MLFLFALGGLVQVVFEWLVATLGSVAPFIGVTIGIVCAVAALLSIVVLVVAARVLLRSSRRWVRVIAVLLIVAETLATVAFAMVAVIAFVAVALLA